MIPIILSSILLLFFFTTFGLFFKKVTRVSANLPEVIFLGLVLTNTLTSWLSLFFRINSSVLLFFILCSLLLFFYFKKELKAILLSFYNKTASHYIIFAFIAIGLILTISYPNNNDTALYHLQTIKWIEEFPVVPGLANLHGRFGFNPNIFTLNALCSFKFIFNQEIFPVNFTIFLVIISYIFNNLYNTYNKYGFSNLYLFYFILFTFVLNLSNLSSPSPDYLATIIPLYIFVRIISLSEDEIDIKKTTPLFILAVYCLTIKLSTLPILAIFLLIALKFRNINIRTIIGNLSICIFIVSPWLLRNIILSGWLIYPFPAVDIFNFDWKVPITKVISEKEAITGWARYPHPSYPAILKMNLSEWVPIWWHNLMIREKLCIISGVLFPIIAFIGVLTKKIKITSFKFFVIVTSFAGIIFWFIMAPDFRFGAVFLITASISFLLFINFSWKPGTYKYSYFNAVLLLPLIYYSYTNRHDLNKSSFKNIISNRLFLPEKIKIPPNRNFETYPIKGGVVFVPTVGDQCYDHQIPCTPNYDSTLTLRGNSLKMGFKTRLK